MPHELNIEHKNTKDILIRNVTIALLDLLNRKCEVQQVVSGKIQTHTVPFFYHFGNDENFMKDFFMEMPHGCKIPDHAEGNFEQNPKGTLKFTGINVKPGEITNKFIRGTVKKAERNENDQKILKAYSAYLFALPININYEATIYADTMNQGMQITESIMEEFYKQYILYFQYKGVRVPAQYEFPDTSTLEKLFDFKYDDNQKLKITFDILMETFYPIFDDKTMRFKGNRIMEFKGSIDEEEYRVTPEYKGSQKISDD